MFSISELVSAALAQALCSLQIARTALYSVAKAWLREHELSKLRSLPPSQIPYCLLSDFTPGICSPAGKTRHNTTAGGTPAPPWSSWLWSSAFPLVQQFFRTEKLLMIHQTECEGQDCADVGRCPSKEGKSRNCGQRQTACCDGGAEPFLCPILRVLLPTRRCASSPSTAVGKRL